MSMNMIKDKSYLLLFIRTVKFISIFLTLYIIICIFYNSFDTLLL